jgi:hypothetical protein
MLGTIWNIMGTPKIVEKSTHSPPQREKKNWSFGCMLAHLIGCQEFLCVPLHFWSRIMAKAMNCGDIDWRNLAGPWAPPCNFWTHMTQEWHDAHVVWKMIDLFAPKKGFCATLYNEAPSDSTFSFIFCV